MRVRTANPKRTDSGSSRFAGLSLPATQARVYKEWTVRKINLWVRVLIMQARRQRFVFQCQHRFDQTSHTRGRIEVSDVALQRTNRTELFSLRLRAKHGG